MKKIFTVFMMMLCAACVASAANYLTFTAEEDGSTFGIVYPASLNLDVQYSKNGGETWNAIPNGDAITLVQKGDKALIKGDNPDGFSKDWRDYAYFSMTGKIAASGSVMSLIDGVGEALVIPSGYCFYGLFSGCASLTQAPELPATTLGNYCYCSMFENCASLAQTPELPATTLSEGCYYSMFEKCASLTQALDLPATTLAASCCSHMFSDCTSLTKAPGLPATTLLGHCYLSMFSGCTSLTQAPELPATALNFNCYKEMFLNCTGLTEAPELPATTLVDGCYLSMFSGCERLSKIKVSFEGWENYTNDWVKYVGHAGTFICPKDLPLEYGASRIPKGWTVKYIEDVSVKSVTLADNITIWSDGLAVYVRGAEGEVSLYDLSGKRVAVSVSADEERVLGVPSKGVYVVRTNNGTSDVLVR